MTCRLSVAAWACGLLLCLIPVVCSHAETKSEGHDTGLPLVFGNYKSYKFIVDNDELLVVSGQIKNVSESNMKVPCLALTTFNQNKFLQQKIFSVPKITIPSQQYLDFRIKLEKPDVSSTRFTVEFTRDCSHAVVISGMDDINQQAIVSDEPFEIGLIFQKYSPTREARNGIEYLVVIGQIKNSTEQMLNVGRLKLETFENNKKLQEKTYKAPVESLPPNGTTDFKLELPEPDPRATRFTVEFTQKPAD
jgi:hypothetical protein